MRLDSRLYLIVRGEVIEHFPTWVYTVYLNDDSLWTMHQLRTYSFIDQLCIQAEQGLRQLSATPLPTSRPIPAQGIPDCELSDQEKKHIAGLMRINHSGEVCAQALYFGQALLVRDQTVRAQLNAAALEEGDHLYWCQHRVHELKSHTSVFNPLWYTLSVLIGMWASLQGEAYSLGFIHATESQVERHLNSHLAEIPERDQKTRAILLQMREDEIQHGQQALQAGGLAFSEETQALMRQVSKIMTRLSYL